MQASVFPNLPTEIMASTTPPMTVTMADTRQAMRFTYKAMASEAQAMAPARQAMPFIRQALSSSP